MHRSQATEFGDHSGVRLGWLRTLTCGAKNSYSRRMSASWGSGLVAQREDMLWLGGSPLAKGVQWSKHPPSSNFSRVVTYGAPFSLLFSPKSEAKIGMKMESREFSAQVSVTFLGPQINHQFFAQSGLVESGSGEPCIRYRIAMLNGPALGSLLYGEPASLFLSLVLSQMLSLKLNK